MRTRVVVLFINQYCKITCAFGIPHKTSVSIDAKYNIASVVDPRSTNGNLSIRAINYQEHRARDHR